MATAITDSSPSRLPWTGVEYASVRDALLNSRAQTTVVVLDCCFSGRAVGTLAASAPEDEVADLAGVQGSYILTASAPDELALAPVGEKYTAFTGELIKLLDEGNTLTGGPITLADAYQAISSRMRERGMPVPRQRISGTAGGLIFRDSSAYVIQPADDRRDPIYDSDNTETFRGDWGYFDSSGQYDKFFELPGTAQMQSTGGADVGLNKRIPTLYGVVELEYLVSTNSPASSPVFFCSIPMRSPIERETMMEVGAQVPGDQQNARSILRQRWHIPPENYNDKRWHIGTFTFDFRDMPAARYAIFAPRINEGSERKADATVAIRRVRIWDLGRGSEKFVDNAGWE